jgi:cadmium resistance protein CadD (predicted permease)
MLIVISIFTSGLRSAIFRNSKNKRVNCNRNTDIQFGMEIILASIIAFASTNIDDIFILTLFFGDKRYKKSDIYIGQYLGIILLIGLSVAGSYLGRFIDSKFIGLLGLFPIYLALRQIVTLIKAGHRTEALEQKEIRISRAGVFKVATITFANGGDNIGVYIPLFATMGTADKTIMISVFLIMVLLWLTVAKYLTTHPVLTHALSKYGHIITPIVLCLLGLFILKENGSFDLLK